MKSKNEIRKDLRNLTDTAFEGHKLSEVQLDLIVFNAYESIKSIVSKHYELKEINSLRKLFVSKSYTDYSDPLVDEMTNECVRRSSKKIGLPFLLTRKLSEAVVRTELKEIEKYFSCNSFSKLLRYFSVSPSFMANEQIRQRTVRNLDAA